MQALQVSEHALLETQEGKRATPNDLPYDFRDKLYSASADGELFKVIDPKSDIDWTDYALAQKSTRVKAEKVSPGTVVETIMSDGLVETTKTAGPEGGYRVINPTGEQYLVDIEKFESIYVVTDEDGIYAPKPDPRKVHSVDYNVAFEAPWGEDMRIRQGGVLIHESPDSIYGIQPKEFHETYTYDLGLS